MGAFEIMAFWSLVAVASGFVGAIIAAMKRRDHSAWAAWCFVFPPALIVLFLLRQNQRPPPPRETLEQADEREHSTI